MDLTNTKRIQLDLRGAVQGIGFRPFLYRLAVEHQLRGWVRNSGEGVQIDVEGTPERVDHFLDRLRSSPPPLAIIESIATVSLPPNGHEGFSIESSRASTSHRGWVLPDLATCECCRQELFDPRNRRYRYPFINCTQCGPRFTIISRLPYDRPQTTMSGFEMCPDCQAEYENPKDRRFHAQPNACPKCGPQIWLQTVDQDVLARHDDALQMAVKKLREGSILALKGLGGFQLVVDAGNSESLSKLRVRKHRPAKPFAVMAPSLQEVRNHCHMDSIEAEGLCGPAAPILLLQTRSKELMPISHWVAPDLNSLGVMLPYTPLHWLLLHDFGGWLVVTSGNRSDEPICIDNDDAVNRLNGIADFFLMHDRPILRHADDSVARRMNDRLVVLRRARGYSSIPIGFESTGSQLVAYGGHLKNTVAIHVNGYIHQSQYLGDLSDARTRTVYRHCLKDIKTLYGGKNPDLVVCDQHPDYASTLESEAIPIPVHKVQHHHAHILSCMAEHNVKPPALGVAWDGTGIGSDNTIWGGEWLRITKSGFFRCATLYPFKLPGGDQAAQQPRRSAAAVCYACDPRLLSHTALTLSFSHTERDAICRLLNSDYPVMTSSMGRLFDAVASLINLCHYNRYEGEAAIRLEELATSKNPETDVYPFHVHKDKTGAHVMDWRPMIRAILEDVTQKRPVEQIATQFHQTLIEMACWVATQERQKRVLLSGGSFQNRILTEGITKRLTRNGFSVLSHHRLPPNDGGLSVGQIVAACWYNKHKSER